MLVALLGFLFLMVMFLTIMVFYMLYRVMQLEDCVVNNAEIVDSLVS